MTDNAAELADQLIDRYRDQAYHRAAEFYAAALKLGDTAGEDVYKRAASLLAARGYDKYAKAETV